MLKQPVNSNAYYYFWQFRWLPECVRASKRLPTQFIPDRQPWSGFFMLVIFTNFGDSHDLF